MMSPSWKSAKPPTPTPHSKPAAISVTSSLKWRTNGSIRDLPDCAKGFQLLAGSVSPSHAYAHLIDWGGTVEVHGMTVSDGDIIHADQHGAVVVPDAAAPGIPAACEKIFRQEKFLIEAAQQPGFTIEDLAAARAASAAIT